MKHYLITAAAFLVMSTPAEAAQCTADATFLGQREGRRAGDADWTTKWRITADCEGSCRGFVKYRLIYYAPSGRQLSESNTASWSISNGRSTEMSDEVESIVCTEDLNECQFADVELKEVSCYD